MPPTANAGADITAYTGQTVLLDGSASTSYTVDSQTNGTPSVKWTTGDGFDVERLVTAPHVYMVAGTYTATLTVKDSSGNTSSDTATVTVSNISTATGGNTQALTDTGNTATNKTNLQNAINTAAANSALNRITYPSGFVADGPITIPSRSSTNFVTIEPADYTGFPTSLTRITDSNKSLMLKIKWGTAAAMGTSVAFEAAAGAKYYRFIGVNIEAYGADDGGSIAVTVNNYATNSNFLFDRCIVDGNGFMRNHGYVANTTGSFSVINSRIEKIVYTSGESKGFVTTESEGPFGMINNYSSVASIHSMSGGSPNNATNLYSNGYVCRGNYYYKDPAWQGVYSSKNDWEIKYGRNSVLVGNIFEGNYQNAQPSNSIQIKTGIDNDSNAVVGTHGVDIRWNKFSGEGGFTISAYQTMTSNPNAQASQIVSNIGFKNNLMKLVSYNGSDMDNVQAYGGHLDVEINHNTFIAQSNHLNFTGEFNTGTGQGSNFAVLNNIWQVSQTGGGSNYNMFGDGRENQTFLDYEFASWRCSKNLMYNGTLTSSIPTGNFTPTGTFANEFTNYAGGDYSLKALSAYKNAATDGTDVGADITTLNTLTSTVISGTFTIGTAAAPVFYRITA